MAGHRNIPPKTIGPEIAVELAKHLVHTEHDRRAGHNISHAQLYTDKDMQQVVSDRNI